MTSERIDFNKSFDNILRAYDEFPDKITSFQYWNKMSSNVLAALRPDVTHAQLAAMTAVMSSGAGINKGLSYALSICQDLFQGKTGDDIRLVGSYGWDNINKAIDIYFNGPTSDNLKGQKVNAIYQLLLFPNCVFIAVGSNEKRVAINDFQTKVIKVSPKETRELIEIIRKVAELRGVKGSDVQAVINSVAHKKINQNNVKIKFA